jgi:hypothetical protein
MVWGELNSISIGSPNRFCGTRASSTQSSIPVHPPSMQSSLYSTLMLCSLLLLLMMLVGVVWTASSSSSRRKGQQQQNQQLQNQQSDDPASVAFLQWTSTLSDHQALNGVFYPSCSDVYNNEMVAGDNDDTACGYDPMVPMDSIPLGHNVPYPTGLNPDCCFCMSSKQFGFCDCENAYYIKTRNNVLVRPAVLRNGGCL